MFSLFPSTEHKLSALVQVASLVLIDRLGFNQGLLKAIMLNVAAMQPYWEGLILWTQEAAKGLTQTVHTPSLPIFAFPLPTPPGPLESHSISGLVWEVWLVTVTMATASSADHRLQVLGTVNRK